MNVKTFLNGYSVNVNNPSQAQCHWRFRDKRDWSCVKSAVWMKSIILLFSAEGQDNLSSSFHNMNNPWWDGVKIVPSLSPELVTCPLRASSISYQPLAATMRLENLEYPLMRTMGQLGQFCCCHWHQTRIGYCAHKLHSLLLMGNILFLLRR